MNRSTLGTILILLAGAAWIWLSKAPPGSMLAEIPAPQTGFMAPDFTLESSTGETITLSDLRGRPVLVNLWASWCPPCRAEMPAMLRVYQDYKAQGFTLLAVNAANQDSSTAALDFAQELGLDFPILFDSQGSVAQQYQISALPTSFFIDAHGIIREVVVGGPMSEALLRIRIQQLIEETHIESP
ncbi:MAG: redoxin domain-containing protein [Chloroflexota bacterium]